jgi:hypothetical protein
MISVETNTGMREEKIKENDGGGGEFKYDLFDILQELLYMPQCNPHPA